MRARTVCVLACGSFLLTACSFSQPPAPVREAGKARRVAVLPPVLPDVYRVRPGDNLFRIALDHGLDYRQLAAWNGLDDPSRLRADDVLRLKPPKIPPPAPAYPLPGAPPTAGTAAPPEPKSADSPAAEALTTDAPEEASPSEWVWPARGEVIARFGASAGANGLDITGRRGSPVVAAAGGKIVYVGAGLRGYGKLIIIKHSQKLLSAYGHNDRVLVSEGQTVRLGQPIAEMGDSDADRVKLHFEIREYGKPVDPLNYLPG